MRGADFEAYVREVSPGLLRFGHVLTLDRSEAEDLAQEMLVRVPDEEIADLLGCSPQTVRSQVSRGLATMRSHRPDEEVTS
jgi:DNA-directed RNA polymerase specialized sigma24 family protein